MEKLLQTGKAKAIGVSNCSKAEMEHILKNASVVPAVHQMECHPWLQQQAFTKWHKEKGIHVTHYSPLGNQNELYSGPKQLGKLIQHPVLCDIGKKHNKSGAQVALGRLILSLFKSITLIADIFQLGELPKAIRFCPSPRPRNASRQTWKAISNSVTRK
jgi:diketogulonate reductase-like aldo/keto reductase